MKLAVTRQWRLIDLKIAEKDIAHRGFSSGIRRQKTPSSKAERATEGNERARLRLFCSPGTNETAPRSSTPRIIRRDVNVDRCALL